MTRVDAGGKGWRLLATKKMLGTSRFGEGEKSLICDPGFELRLGGREREKLTKIKVPKVVQVLSGKTEHGDDGIQGAR